VVLATGGASGIYEISTNASRPVGDGIALAWRAGCRVADLEMMQFHPTALRHPEAEGWLVTEAVRGEGGRLLLPDGERFMFRYDPRGELAPRDVVARALHAEMQAHRLDFVLLDISHAGARNSSARISPTPGALPGAGHRHHARADAGRARGPLHLRRVVTGGAGETDLAGLFAIGETAWTGLHGANRLASNSLLEGLVFAEAAARRSSRRCRAACPASPAPSEPPRAVAGPLPGPGRRRSARARRRRSGVPCRATWASCAVTAALPRRVRALERCSSAARRCMRARPVRPSCWSCATSPASPCWWHAARCCGPESRGAHFNVDHPQTPAQPMSTVLRTDGAVVRVARSRGRLKAAPPARFCASLRLSMRGADDGSC
jgi:L-aspartate oxidase